MKQKPNKSLGIYIYTPNCHTRINGNKNLNKVGTDSYNKAATASQ